MGGRGVVSEEVVYVSVVSRDVDSASYTSTRNLRVLIHSGSDSFQGGKHDNRMTIGQEPYQFMNTLIMRNEIE